MIGFAPDFGIDEVEPDVELDVVDSDTEDAAGRLLVLMEGASGGITSAVLAGIALRPGAATSLGAFPESTGQRCSSASTAMSLQARNAVIMYRYLSNVLPTFLAQTSIEFE